MIPVIGDPILDGIPTRPGVVRPPEGWEQAVIPVGDVGPFARVRSMGDGGMWRHHIFALTVIMSAARELDEKRWIHLSVARPSKLPDWEDITHVRNLFLGPEAMAIQVIAPASRHVSIHRYCMHLWHCLDGSPLPDFTRGGDSL